MTKFLNIDLDTKLGGSTPSDVLVSSQKAIKTYVDSKLLEETTRAQGAEAGLDTRVSTNEDDIAMNKDEIGTLTTDMSTAKTDITNLKTSINTQANLISDLQDSKQDKIDNLDTIVAGAASGATAVQPSAIADMETKTHASATYQPKGDYALTSSVNAVATKVSGIEAKIPDSASADNKLATKADLENVSVAVDGTTITKKADGKIQASAVVNQNSGVLKSWTGTLAEYNALETKSYDTIYVITDDNSEGVNVYTKSEVDGLLNNKQDTLVSGTNIKTVNGETLLGSGNIKIESGSSGSDYVIEYQMPTAENNYTWYRKYKSDWVEQGGYIPQGYGEIITVEFPIPMATNHNPIWISIQNVGDETVNFNSIGVGDVTTTGFSCYEPDTYDKYWKTEGMAA